MEWTTIRSTADQIITPSSSTELAGAADVVFDGLAHNDLLTDPTVFTKISAAVFDGVDPGASAALEAAPAAVPVAPAPAEGGGGVLVTRLDVVPDGRRDVGFSLCRGSDPCRSFALDDDADPTLARRHRAGDLAPGTYRVVARPPAGWSVTGVGCDPVGDGDAGRSRARVVLTAGDRVTCTFTVARTPTTTTTSTTTTSTPTTTTSSTTTSTSTTSTSTTTSTTAPPPPPANDALAAAQVLNGGVGTTSGTNRRATVQAGETEHAETGATRTVWYRWPAPITAALSFDTCASGFDTVLGVYSGPATGPTPATLTEVGADDDSCGAGSRVRFSSSAGTTYYVVVGGYGGAQGDLVLRRQVVGLPGLGRLRVADRPAPRGGPRGHDRHGHGRAERARPRRHRRRALGVVHVDGTGRRPGGLLDLRQ